MNFNKKAYKDFKDKSPIMLQLGLILILFFVLVYVIFYLFNDYISSFLISSLMYGGILSIILIVCFFALILGFISPLIYSYFASNNVLDGKMKENVTIKNFFRTYKIGSAFPLKGQLKLFTNLLFTFLIYLCFIFITSLITFSIMYQFNALSLTTNVNEIIKYVNDFYYQSEIGNTDGMTNALSNITSFLNNQDKMYPFMYPITFINFFAILFSLYFFIHQINLGTFRYYIASSFGGVNAKYSNLIFKQGIKNIRKEFYKDYYDTLYPLLIIFILVFTLSYFSLYFVKNIIQNGLYILSSTSILITLSILILLMPISFNHFTFLWNKYNHNFVNTFITLANESLTQMKETYNNFDNEKKEQLKKAEDNLNKIKDQLKNDHSDKDESDDSKDDQTK